MREVVCALYIVFYTWITAPARYINTRHTDPKAIKEGRAKNYKLTQIMCRRLLKLAGAKLHVSGQEKLPSKETGVYMGTHKSYFDIVIMIALIDEPLIFIGKEEVNKMPFIRTWFRTIGGIAIERDDIRQSFQVILEAIKQLKNGYSVAIFPEGTRAVGEEMGEFKAGSFKLATKANVPIIPMAMQNTFKLLEEKRRVKPADIYVNIGEPIDVPNLTKDKQKTIAKDTESYVRELLKESNKNDN